MDNRMIEVININYSYPDGYKAINEITFAVNKNCKLAIIGENGAGKSTILKIIIGLLFPRRGEVFIEGNKVCKDNLKEIRKKVGFIFQESDNQLFMSNVYDDIAFGLRKSGLDEELVHMKVDKIIKDMGIEELRNKQTYKLSGGEKKAVAIAGIMVMEPDIILMDEPTASLDPKARRRVINLVKDLNKTIVIATHDLDMVLDCCDKTIIFSNGKIAKEGNTLNILIDEEFLESCNLEKPLSLQLKNRL